ncbi:flagellar protein FlaG [Bacillus sp. RG28]|uniref:Flagellar protein FlaG n=1 Tax=Gottfriedia endophytica TaxID=2820819 RepID=A0A940NTD8_9BACI|nr:flagellar protein FlaG [Gottfriedia endophytica]MBP0726727.1 flagellar protein FlaG [Gottfriedia endophytica]
MLNNISSSKMAGQVPNIPAQQQSQEVKEFPQKEPKSDKDDKQVPKEKLEKVIDKMNQFLEPSYTNVQFKLHEKTHSYYAVVVNSSTNEVIREIPAKKMLDIYADMMTHIGLLVDKKI